MAAYIFFYFLEDKHPIQTLVHLLKYSTDFGQTICDLGGIHILATMIEVYFS